MVVTFWLKVHNVVLERLGKQMATMCFVTPSICCTVGTKMMKKLHSVSAKTLRSVLLMESTQEVMSHLTLVPPV